MKGTIKYLFYIIVITIIAISCDDSDSEQEIPTCIENKIENLKTNVVTNPPTQIWKWMDNGDTYYYITSDCCDQFNYLYNENCEIVCAPDGGITGNGDGNCPTFSNNIVKTLVWEDQRN